MDALALLNETQESFVSDPSLGTSEPIEYRHSSGLVISDLYAFVGEGIFNREKGKSLTNLQTFSSLKLPLKPTADDTILYNGIVHNVSEFVLIGSLWAVDTVAKRHRGM